MGIITVNIPEKRKDIIAAARNKIEKSTKTKIRIHNCVEVEGSDEGLFIASEIVKAIGRGFEPKIALLLLNENYLLNEASISDRNVRKRLFARVIGRAGRVKSDIERMTGVHICIYGKTISIIGDSDVIGIAKRAVEMLLKGKSHSAMYVFLKKELRKF